MIDNKCRREPIPKEISVNCKVVEHPLSRIWGFIFRYAHETLCIAVHLLANLICKFIPQPTSTLDVRTSIIQAYDNLRFPACQLTSRRDNNLCRLPSKKKGFSCISISYPYLSTPPPFLPFSQSMCRSRLGLNTIDESCFFYFQV